MNPRAEHPTTAQARGLAWLDTATEAAWRAAPEVPPNVAAVIAEAAIEALLPALLGARTADLVEARHRGHDQGHWEARAAALSWVRRHCGTTLARAARAALTPEDR